MSSYFTNGETEGQRSGLPKVIPPMSSRVQVHALLTAPAVPCSADLDKNPPCPQGYLLLGDQVTWVSCSQGEPLPHTPTRVLGTEGGLYVQSARLSRKHLGLRCA